MERQEGSGKLSAAGARAGHRVVVGDFRPCVSEPAERLQVGLREVLEVRWEVPSHEADRIEREADDEDADDEVDVLHRFHPEAALDLRDRLEEKESKEQVVDALEKP